MVEKYVVVFCLKINPIWKTLSAFCFSVYFTFNFVVIFYLFIYLFFGGGGGVAFTLLKSAFNTSKYKRVFNTSLQDRQKPTVNKNVGNPIDISKHYK